MWVIGWLMFGRSVSHFRGDLSSFRMRAIFLTFLTIPHSRGFLVSDVKLLVSSLQPQFLLETCVSLRGTVLCTAKDHTVDMIRCDGQCCERKGRWG